MSLAAAVPARTSDADVLRRVRRGDAEAFGLLYSRHVTGARCLARSITRRPSDVEDVVAEAFASSFAAITRGKGPVDGFGTYLLSCVRHECYRSWRKNARRQVVVAPASFDQHPEATGVLDDYARLDENDVLQRAFDTLPMSMRVVLWQTEVEDASHADIARMTGSTAQAVATLAVRARRALSANYLTAHLVSTAPADQEPPDCRAARADLASMVRGTASDRRRHRSTAHLAGCPSCTEAYAALEGVNQRLRSGSLGLLLVGVTLQRIIHVGVKARAVTWLGGSVAPILAVTAMAFVGVAPPSPFAAPPPREPVATTVPVVARQPTDPGAPVVVTPPAGYPAAAPERSVTTPVASTATTAPSPGELAPTPADVLGDVSVTVPSVDDPRTPPLDLGPLLADVDVPAVPVVPVDLDPVVPDVVDELLGDVVDVGAVAPPVVTMVGVVPPAVVDRVAGPLTEP